MKIIQHVNMPAAIYVINVLFLLSTELIRLFLFLKLSL
jgi:hypothetical protein